MKFILELIKDCIKEAKLALLALLLLTLTASDLIGATAVTNWTAAATNSILTTNVMIARVSVTAGTFLGGGTANVNFYDNNVAANTYTNAAYTSLSSYTTNYSYVITNSQNFLQTNYYPALVFTTNTVVANTNTLPALGSFSLLTGTSEIRTVQWNCIKGLTASCNQSNVVVIIDYVQTYP